MEKGGELTKRHASQRLPHRRLAHGSRAALLPLPKVASRRSSRNFSQEEGGAGWEQGAMFCKMKEPRRFVDSPVNQPGGVPPVPQTASRTAVSEDSCEGLHHLGLKDDEVPLLRSP